MNVEVITTDNFEREAKKLLKKYKSLKGELAQLEGELLLTPRLGTELGNNAYKSRLAVKSKGKGKSGGLRIITYVDLNIYILQDQKKSKDEFTVALLSIYDKSEVASISKKEINRLIERLDL